MPDLTIKQLSVLRFIQRHHRETGRYATMRNICANFGWTSSATAYAHVHALERQGFLKRLEITDGQFVYWPTEKWWERNG